MLKFRKPFIIEWWCAEGSARWLGWQLVIIDRLEQRGSDDYVLRLLFRLFKAYDVKRPVGWRSGV